MMENDTTGWRAVGAPLIEQDAEYLAELIARESIPHELSQIEEGDEEGRSWIVRVQPKHYTWALEIRSNEFPEPGDDPEAIEKAYVDPTDKRPVVRTLFLGFVGAVMGLRVGVKLRGGAWGMIAASAAMALLAMAASVMYGQRNKPTPEETAQMADADTGEEDEEEEA